MEDSRSEHIVELKRQIALLQTNERRLVNLATSRSQTEIFKVRAQEDLTLVREDLARLAKELNDVDHRQ